jgi:TetR/AcrR family transcriptional regulator, cholesterol catabolism regulator
MEQKDRILLKAHELFSRFGIRSVSMDDIAGQLGISKKTVYQYYVDKEELVSAVFSAIMDDNKKHCTMDREKADNAIHEVFLAFEWVQEMLANMNPSVLFDMEKYHPGTFKKFKEYQNGFLYQMIRSNIERGIEEGLYREDVDIDILTRYRIYSITLPFNPEVFPTNRTELVHIEKVLLEHFLYGMATGKGEKLIVKYKSKEQKNRISR